MQPSVQSQTRFSPSEWATAVMASAGGILLAIVITIAVLQQAGLAVDLPPIIRSLVIATIATLAIIVGTSVENRAALREHQLVVQQYNARAMRDAVAVEIQALRAEIAEQRAAAGADLVREVRSIVADELRPMVRELARLRQADRDRYANVAELVAGVERKVGVSGIDGQVAEAARTIARRLMEADER